MFDCYFNFEDFMYFFDGYSVGVVFDVDSEVIGDDVDFVVGCLLGCLGIM